jgi:hypothetical protein
MARSPHDPDFILSVGSGYINSAYCAMTSYTTDGGTTWLHDTLDPPTRLNTVTFDPIDPNRVFAGGDSYYSYRYLIVSTDRGATWNRSDNGLTGPVYSLVPAPGNPNVWYCATGIGLYKSTDNGANWTRKGTINGQRAVCVDTVNPNVVYGAGEYGVYSSTDAGETRQPFNTGLPTSDIQYLALRSGPSGVLYAGTNGRSIYMTDPLVGIADRKPFTMDRSPLTATIVRGVLFLDGDCPRMGTVPKTVLLDISGRKAMDLVPGPNDVRQLAPGVYFVREQSVVSNQYSGPSSVRKLVVQR